MKSAVLTLVCAPTDLLWATQIAKLVEYTWLHAFAQRLSTSSDSGDLPWRSNRFGLDSINADEDRPSGLRSRHKEHWHAASQVPEIIVRVRAALPGPDADAAAWTSGVLGELEGADLLLLLPSTTATAMQLARAMALEIPKQRVLVLRTTATTLDFVSAERLQASTELAGMRPSQLDVAEAILGEGSSLLARTYPGDPAIHNYSGGQIWRVLSQLGGNAVNLAIAVPREVAAGTTFSARFAAYIASRESGVVEQLKRLSAGLADPASGFVPDELSRWRNGTPIRVRLSGGTAVQPLEQSFEWKGRDHLLTFSVEAPPGESNPTMQLQFEVSIEAVTVAVITTDVVLKKGVTAAIAVTTASPAPSAFASYAKADREEVAQCLSALVHWTPTLDVFMDCLDLTPNDDWQAELERVIPQKAAFLLFWSRNAMQSKWVNWELQTAIRAHGTAGITPMPLEDPELAPPPAGLDRRHFSSRFQVTKDAFAFRRSRLIKPSM